MNKILKFSSKSVLLASALIVFASCNDKWNDHYSYKTDSDHPVAKLYDALSDMENYDKFCKALETTYLCNKDGERYENDQSFMDLLLQDQFLTVWAPSNKSISDEDWKKYTDPNKSDSLNKEVGDKFIKNHIARFKHTAGVAGPNIFMLSGKTFKVDPAAFGGQAYHEKNIRCLNGILHCLDGYLEYRQSLYEYIVEAPEYKDLIGDWFKGFTKVEIDPTRSIASGTDENGEMIWIDAVMVESNILMDKFGYIHTEDSLYAVVLPTPELWQTQFNRIKKYFYYVQKGLDNDSLQKFYTRTTMMADMFFNIKEGSQFYLPDSVFSTLYNRTENRRDNLPYHIFGKPYEAGGLFADAVKTIDCSNGTIYVIDKWPFEDTLNFKRPIRLEAENYYNLSGLDLYPRSVNSIGKKPLDEPVQVMRISKYGENDWSAKFLIPDNLRGKYAVKIVVAPNMDAQKPNYFHPRVAYNSPNQYDSVLIDSNTVVWTYLEDWDLWIDDIGPLYLVNDTSKIDTLEIGDIFIPYCNYDMNQSALSVTIKNGITTSSLAVQYATELWVDCILLEPVVE